VRLRRLGVGVATKRLRKRAKRAGSIGRFFIGRRDFSNGRATRIFSQERLPFYGETRRVLR
jgi:hypothetical protein